MAIVLAGAIRAVGVGHHRGLTVLQREPWSVTSGPTGPEAGASNPRTTVVPPFSICSCWLLTSIGLHTTPLQPFSQKSRTPTVAKEFPIGLYDPAEVYDPAEADLELSCNSWCAGFLGERLYSRFAFSW